jgi:flagellar export protein FliJ
VKRFVFRLDAVLRIRLFELERARLRLMQLEAERVRRELRVDAVRARLERGEARLREEMAAGIDGRRLGLHAMGLAVGRFECVRAETVLEQLRPELEEARQALREARVRVRSLERLREKRVQAHRERMQRLEQAELDESAIGRASRAASGALDVDAKGEWIQ